MFAALEMVEVWLWVAVVCAVIATVLAVIANNIPAAFLPAAVGCIALAGLAWPGI